MTYRYFGTLRFFFSLLVVFQHFGFNLASGKIKLIAGAWLPGTPSVLCFYMLSGFVISEAAHEVYSGRPFTFLANRFIRIVIPVWVALTLLLIVLFGCDVIAGHVVLYDRTPIGSAIRDANTLGLNYFGLWPSGLWPLSSLRVNPDLLVVIWSIRYEIVFYMVVSLGISIGNSPLATGAKIAFYFATILASFIATRAWTPGSWDYFHISIAPSFCLGALVYYWNKKFRTNNVFALALILSLGLCATIYPSYAPTNGTALTVNQIATMVTLAIVSFWLIDIKFPTLKRLDCFLGNMSYSLYLTHLIVQTVLFNVGFVGSTASFALAIVTSLVIAYVFHRLMDPLLASLRDRLRGKSIQAVPQDAAATNDGNEAAAVTAARKRLAS